MFIDIYRFISQKIVDKILCPFFPAFGEKIQELDDFNCLIEQFYTNRKMLLGSIF